jgi:hypothetical protein
VLAYKFLFVPIHIEFPLGLESNLQANLKCLISEVYDDNLEFTAFIIITWDLQHI